MTKFLLLLVTLWAVIHRGNTSNVNRTQVIDPKISFIDTADESDSISEKIRTGMDKRVKENELKKLLNSTTTTTETSSAPTTTLSALMTSEISSIAPDSSTAISSSTAAITSSTTEHPSTELPTMGLSTTELSTSEQTTLATPTTTIRRIVLNDLVVEESPDDPDYIDIDTTMAPSENDSNGVEVDDRFILNAPAICAEGRVPVNGKCRKVIS